MIKIGSYVSLKKHKKSSEKKIRESYFKVLSINEDDVILSNRSGSSKMKDLYEKLNIKTAIAKKITKGFMEKDEVQLLTDCIDSVLLFDYEEDALEYLIETNIHINNINDMHKRGMFFFPLDIIKKK